MANENELILEISANLSELTKDLNSAKRKLGSLDDTTKNVDDRMTKRFKGWSAGFGKFGLAVNGVQAAFAMLDKTFGEALRTITGFQTAMTEVNTLLNLTGEQFQALNDQVVELSNRIPQTAEQLSNGLYQVVSAGVDASEAMGFLETSAKGAVAGLTDTETSVDAITSVINAYGLEASEAERVSDLFFQTVKLGKTTFGEMASVMGQVVPTASAFGVSFDQIAGAFATMTKSGVKTAQTATALNATINEMVRPAGKAEKAILKLNKEADSAIEVLGEKGLQETIIELTESGVNMAEIFGQEALKAVLTLGKSAKTTRDDLDDMNTSAGATNTAFETMNTTIDNQRKLLDNQLSAIYLRFGKILIPAWTRALRDLNAVLDDQSAIAKAMNVSGKSEIDQLEARATAIDSIVDSMWDWKGSRTITMELDSEELENVRKLGIGYKDLNTIEELIQRLQTESIEARQRIIELRKVERKEAKDEAEEKERQAENEREFGDEELQAEVQRHSEVRGYREAEIELAVDNTARQMQMLELLQGGWKDYLKQRANDWITSKQLEMLGSLGTIWAEGGATLGASLAVSLPMYATGLIALEGARALITAFAEGGRVDSPTLALIGEAGAEFVAPEADFEQYSRDTLTPMIQAQVETKLLNEGGTGMLKGGLTDIKNSVDNLTAIASAPMTVLTGTHLQVIKARLNRGQLVQ